MKIKRFIKKFTEDSYLTMLDELHLILDNLGLDNLNGQIVTLTIPSGSEVAINHRLKRTPKYRIILKKSAEGEIIDGAKEWTSNLIYLKNSGLTSNTITVLIL